MGRTGNTTKGTSARAVYVGCVSVSPNGEFRTVHRFIGVGGKLKLGYYSSEDTCSDTQFGLSSISNALRAGL